MSDARAATGSGLAIAEEPPTGATLAGYGTVPIAFEVREVLECTPRDGALGGLALVPRLVERPWRKDYDAYHDEGDVQRRLSLLSTYLGHVNPGATYWYLSAAPELLALAGQRLERHLGARR